MVALGLKKGVLWNTRTNAIYNIVIPDEEAFLNAVANAITKGAIGRYYKPAKNMGKIAIN